jgi:hypothetical protein
MSPLSAEGADNGLFFVSGVQWMGIRWLGWRLRSESGSFVDALVDWAE